MTSNFCHLPNFHWMRLNQFNVNNVWRMLLFNLKTNRERIEWCAYVFMFSEQGKNDVCKLCFWHCILYIENRIVGINSNSGETWISFDDRGRRAFCSFFLYNGKDSSTRRLTILIDLMQNEYRPFARMNRLPENSLSNSQLLIDYLHNYKKEKKNHWPLTE